MKSAYFLLVIVLTFFSINLRAEISVIDISEDKNITSISPTPYQPTPMVENQYNSSSNYPQNNLSVEERLSKIEHQIAYLQQTLSPTRINTLEQSIQELRGFIEIQGHQIQDLSKSQQSSSNGLDQSLSSINSMGASKPFSPSSEKIASDKEIQVYANAFNYIKQKQYTPAIASLQNYLKQYPEGQYTASAHYWLGELSLISGDSKQAFQEFNIIIQNYPNSDKMPDTLLKLGNLSFDQGRRENAKAYWQKLTRNYPNSSAARIADLRLNQLSTTTTN